jgi:5'-nucleotidase
MHFLLTNDDGIDAEGLQALIHAAAKFGEVIVVAPATHQSGCSHQTTTDREIVVDERDAGQSAIKRFAVHGTPADCVRLGLLHLAPKASWVLSGVNHGGNLGADVYVSGTVAAVREGLLLGVQGIAFSQYRKSKTTCDWSAARAMTQRVLDDLLTRQLAPREYWNVNFPDVAGSQAIASDPANVRDLAIVDCLTDPHPLPVLFERTERGYSYKGDYHGRTRLPQSDIATCFSGSIAVSKLSLH